MSSKLNPNGVACYERGHYAEIIGALHLVETHGYLNKEETARCKDAVHALAMDMIESIERTYEEKEYVIRISQSGTDDFTVRATNIDEAKDKALDMARGCEPSLYEIESAKEV